MDKIQHPLMIRIFNKVGIGGNFLNLIKGIYEKLTANIIVNGERLTDLSLRSGPRSGYLSHHF